MSIIDKKNQNIPIFCPLCDYVMATSDDSLSYRDYGACCDCVVAFAESRKDQWHDGWRPSRVEVSSHKKRMSKRVRSILLEIDNYI
jgi:hypothetical protein